MVKETLKKLANVESLGFAETSGFIDAVASGEVTDAQIASFLTGMRLKGETLEEIAGCVSALRRHALSVPHHQELVFDCCGTGGDGSHSFNISTTAAFVVAGCGVPTAKHGNRAVSSSCGSADVLEEAGANIEVGPAQAARLLDEIGFCFLFAPSYHPVAKRVGQIRRELGFPTMFNLLGPLLNPAGATHQIVGTASEAAGQKLASLVEYLPGLNIVTLFNSLGFDELLPIGVNHVYRWDSGSIVCDQIAIPAAMLNGFVPESVVGGDKRENLAILKRVLEGDESYYGKVTMLNAALGLVHVKRAKNMEEGLALAEESIKSGRALTTFSNYVRMSREGI